MAEQRRLLLGLGHVKSGEQGGTSPGSGVTCAIIQTFLALCCIFTFFAQGFPLLVVNQCLKQSPLPRRMGNTFMSQQVQTITVNGTNTSYITESGYFHSYGLWARHCAAGDPGSLCHMQKQIHTLFFPFYS